MSADRIDRGRACRCGSGSRARGLDGVTLLVLPAVLFVARRCSSIRSSTASCCRSSRRQGGWLANYQQFFSDPFLYDTIATTLWLAVAGHAAQPVARRSRSRLRVRLMQRQRLLTTILVLPITLGTVLVAEGLLNYLGPQGWFNRTLMTFGLIDQPGAAGAQLLGRVAVAGDHRLSRSPSC